jgi:hypothetical protein
VGVGDPLEAAFALVAPVDAGNWHLVGDGIIFNTCDVTFDLLWRSTSGDQTLGSWSQHFDAPPAGPAQFDAIAYDADASAPAVAAQPGDQLVLRFTVTNEVGTGGAYIPNSHGAQANGRIPSVTLPP